MMAWLSDRIDRFRGRGAHAPTMPPMDGALRPNTRLEDAAVLARVDAPDNLVLHQGGVLFSSGAVVQALDPATGAVREWRRFDAPVTALCSLGDRLAVALADGRLTLGDQAVTGLPPRACITALSGGEAGTLIVCIGSAQNGPADWTRDLLQHGATGSVWSVATDGVATQIAGRLAWPSGAAAAQGTITVTESWRHQLTQLGGAPVVTDLPGYPSRLIPAGDGWWMCVFAPRNQLIELVLREAAYRDRMMAEVDPKWWVAPTLSRATSFYEPMQGGAIRTHGIVKPWAPTRSYGLLVRLDAAFRPVASYHSRADGWFHGITSALPFGDRVLVASRGGNAILSLTPVQA